MKMGLVGLKPLMRLGTGAAPSWRATLSPAPLRAPFFNREAI
jgi:hypothetical protein